MEYELKLKDLNLQGVFKISHVYNAAMESNYIFLNKYVVLSQVDVEKRMIYGVVMIPNKKIPRIEEKTGEAYDIWFSKETIEAVAHQYAKSFRTGNTNIEHSTDIDGVNTVETWIVIDPELDKSKALGLDAPIGSWVIGQKVDNDDFWNDYVKTKKVRGFSIEGLFTPVENEMDTVLKAIDELLNLN